MKQISLVGEYKTTMNEGMRGFTDPGKNPRAPRQSSETTPKARKDQRIHQRYGRIQTDHGNLVVPENAIEERGFTFAAHRVGPGDDI